MKFSSLIFSPLDQFEILPILSLNLGFADFTITNVNVILALIFFFLTSLYFLMINIRYFTFSIQLNNWPIIFNIVYNLIKDLIINNIGPKGSKFFPLVYCIFMYIVCLNLIGLIPYSYTITSHLIVTFALALFIFIGINIITARYHGFEMFSLFLPSGTSLALAFLLVPIELISYVFKPVSLSIRLFANMMAGHTLLKVIAGFAYTMMGLSGIIFFVHYVPLLILIPLFLLELGVSLIQAFVFSVLICIYLNDAINLH
jgi:F0F1-type ATP synthase membrane subunit a